MLHADLGTLAFQKRLKKTSVPKSVSKALCLKKDGDHLLTFELYKDTEKIFVHGDPAGLEYFANALLKTVAQAKKWEIFHNNFFTEEWGGNELSSEKQGEEDKLINPIKVFFWTSIERAKPYEKT